MNMFLLPYKRGSQGSRALSEALGIRRIRLERSRFRATADKVILNWGNTTTEVNTSGAATWINPPPAVSRAIDKRQCLQTLIENEVPCIEVGWDMDMAAGWLSQGHDVVLRTTATGKGGEGIHIMEGDASKSFDESWVRLREYMNENGLTRIPLITKYFKAKDEYRVHVFDGHVIDVQQKRKRGDIERSEVNYKVRNHDNGFVFCRENVDLPACCAEASIAAVQALGLDFGAVDLRYNSTDRQCAVLEVNTAPGLEGTTLEIYVNAVRELIEQIDV